MTFQALIQVPVLAHKVFTKCSLEVVTAMHTTPAIISLFSRRCISNHCNHPITKHTFQQIPRRISLSPHRCMQAPQQGSVMTRTLVIKAICRIPKVKLIRPFPSHTTITLIQSLPSLKLYHNSRSTSNRINQIPRQRPKGIITRRVSPHGVISTLNTRMHDQHRSDTTVNHKYLFIRSEMAQWI